jgi:hypothetical protein
MTTINQYVEQCHYANRKWWQDIQTGRPIERNRGELLALIHSEIWEAFSAKGFDDHLPDREGEEVEIADALIRIFDYCGGNGVNLEAAFYAVSEDEEAMMENASSMNLNDYCEYFPVYYLRRGGNGNLSVTRRSDWYVAFHLSVSAILEAARKNVRTHKDTFVKTGIVFKEDLELATLVTLLFAYCRLKQFDIDGAFQEKMEYNRNRSDHKPENRAKEGGKKF